LGGSQRIASFWNVDPVKILTRRAFGVRPRRPGAPGTPLGQHADELPNLQTCLLLRVAGF
jgi:hypothetical protein